MKAMREVNVERAGHVLSSWRRVVAMVCMTLVPAFVAAADSSASTKRWQQLEQSRWIEDGRSSAPRRVYMFTDPNCPYCNKLWTDARPWVDAGKVQIRHVMVGILTPTSNGKAATLLNAKNPVTTLASYEQGQSFTTARMIASGNVHALNAVALEPLATIPSTIQASLDANRKLMQSLGLRATPAIAWRDSNGDVQVLEGVAPEDEARVFGPH